MLGGIDWLIVGGDGGGQGDLIREMRSACQLSGLPFFHTVDEHGAIRRVAVGAPFFHDVDDPWRFVRHALNDELRARGATLDPDKYEECVSYLTEKLCRLALRFVEGQGSLSFSSLAYRILRRRYTDYLREWRGDARYGTWSGGESTCRHARLRDEVTGRYMDPPHCECGALWVGNDGREQAVAEMPAGFAPTTVDADSFQALIDQLDHDMLSRRARGTLNEVVAPMIEENLTATELADRLGKSRREITRDLDRLKMELEEMLPH